MIAYWPDITEEEIEEQPGFYNDYNGWANWRAELESEPDVVQTLMDLGVAPILTVKTDGGDDTEVEWVTPQELSEAAQKLKTAVQEKRPGITRLLEVYERHAIGEDPSDVEFTQDLRDIQVLCRWAEEKGARRMTLEVNW